MTTTVATDRLPKYVQNANTVLATVAAEPNGEWGKTQRELGECLNLPQPVLSSLVKLLLEHGKLKRGRALPVRGKNFALQVVDATPFTGPIGRPQSSTELVHRPDDRPLAEGEVVEGAFALGGFTVQKLGEAVLYTLKNYMSKEERWNSQRAEMSLNIQRAKDRADEERKAAERFRREAEDLQRKLENIERDRQELRARMNQLTMAAGRRGDPSVVPAREVMDEDSRRVLEVLMKERPGQYRESDRQVAG